MSDSHTLNIHTDGASRGNPGAAAFAYVLQVPGQSPIEVSGCLGSLTNNQAEYTALVRALEHALTLNFPGKIVVHSDSELMVKQVNGQYRVKNEELRPLYEKAISLIDRFPQGVKVKHVYREQNRRADELCNEALDGFPRPAQLAPPASAPASTPPLAAAPALPAGLRAQALEILRAAKTAWEKNHAASPSPEDVWNQLTALVARHLNT